MTQTTGTSTAPTYAPGTPMWVDLATTDVEGAKRFYGGLFDWTAEDLGPEAGGYQMFRLNGRMTAGVGPLQNPQQPPAWTTYIATEDADATARKVNEAGGQVFVPPMDVMTAGRMAIFADPTGAVFGVWQPGQHRGAEHVTDPGGFSWTELATRDIERAKTFYQKVFGWGVKASPEYTEWQVNGRSIGGGMQMDERFPPNVPPHWLVYFTVADLDASLARAQQLGGTVQMPATDIPSMGRFAVLTDPQGAAFALFQST